MTKQTLGTGSSGPAPQVSKELLDRLDDAALQLLKIDSDRGRRAHARYRYRHADVRLVLSHAGGAQTTRSIWTRNISAGGLAFLDTQRPLAEARCRLILPGIDKKLHPVDGVVRSLRPIEGAICEVGVQFAEPVDLAVFIGMSTATRLRTG